MHIELGLRYRQYPVELKSRILIEAQVNNQATTNLMLFSSAYSRRSFQRWITLLGILLLHLAVLWIFIPGKNQPKTERVQYLSLFNGRSIETLKNTAENLQPPVHKNRRKSDVTKAAIPETTSNAQRNDMTAALPSTSNIDSDIKLNLEALRGQAVQIERTRVKSDIEKMNERKKLNLSIEATLDREINQIELPECRAILLGKLMPERMMIIQDHSKKKFCRSSM